MREKQVDLLIDEIGLGQAGVRLRVAAILFTYRCTIQCRHCLFASAPDRPDVVMTPRHCADALGLLHETGRVIHIAGGEPMLYWNELREALRLAHQEGNAPHFVETNCSFALNNDIVRERLGFMADHGVKGLYASSDPYHMEFVPAENFLRVRDIAREIFGDRNFWGSGQSEEEIREQQSLVADEQRLREYVRSSPVGMVGGARRNLARYMDQYAPDDDALPRWGWQGPVADRHCLSQFRSDLLWEIHIDPYGNIQSNCGIILGNIREMTPAQVLARGPENANRFVRIVCEQGVGGLVELARREHGFVPPESVSQTCELCYVVRTFLRKFYPDVFGPQEVYD